MTEEQTASIPTKGLKQKMNKAIDKIIPKIALPVIAIAAVLLIVIMLQSSKDTGEQNNAYIRVINCIVSYNASTRTQEDIERCYVTVERDLNVKLQRYDSSQQ